MSAAADLGCGGQVRGVPGLHVFDLAERGLRGVATCGHRYGHHRERFPGDDQVVSE